MDYEGVDVEGRSHTKVKRREPAKSPLFWVLWTLLILLSVPWYFPPKTYEPLIGGLPLWVIVVMIVNVMYAVFVTVSAYKFWR